MFHSLIMIDQMESIFYIISTESTICLNLHNLKFLFSDFRKMKVQFSNYAGRLMKLNSPTTSLFNQADASTTGSFFTQYFGGGKSQIVNLGTGFRHKYLCCQKMLLCSQLQSIELSSLFPPVGSLSSTPWKEKNSSRSRCQAAFIHDLLERRKHTHRTSTPTPKDFTPPVMTCLWMNRRTNLACCLPYGLTGPLFSPLLPVTAPSTFGAFSGKKEMLGVVQQRTNTPSFSRKTSLHLERRRRGSETWN